MDGSRTARFALTPALALAALAGVLAVQALPQLPPAWLALVLPVVVVPLGWRWPSCRALAFCLVAFGWTVWRADAALEARLPRSLEGRDFVVTGVVDDLPLRRTDAARFSLRVEQAELDGEAVALDGLVRLSWYARDAVAPEPCSRWRLTVRLKRPRGLVNPGGFDGERHALERGIVAVGYVRDDAANAPIGTRGFCVDRLRADLSAGIAARVADAHDARLLQAFAVGDTRALDARDWEVARANGVTHLIAISGFHVGVVAVVGAWLARLLWWLLPALALRVPLPIAQAPAALLAAIGYGALAGNSLPTVRTLLMIAVVVLARLGRRGGNGLQSLALALLAILLVDPLAVLGAGFWLSFVGVAFLMLCLQRERGALGFVRELGLGQWVMTLALLPLTVWFFGEASLVGAVSNLVAVPFVSLLIVPLTLLGTVLLMLAPPLAGAVLWLAGQLAHAQWWLWQHLSTWPGAHWYLPAVGPLALVLATFGAFWLFLPRGVPLRALGLALFVPLLAPPRERLPDGAFEAWTIDVGQGLSVFVRTRSHALLFDAGARYPSEFDLGEAAVLPSLRALGVDALDLLFVSHADNDHAGGAPAVARAYPQAARYGGEPERLDLPMQPCVAGQHWTFDAVAVRVLWPPADTTGVQPGNDRSCVVLVEGQGGRLLLTGDITRRVEAEVAAAIGPGAPLIVQAPHHGSRSSSSAAFIDALAPRQVLFSAGWRSRFGHPHPLVVQRYAQAGAQLANTAEAGALRVDFAADAAPAVATGERARQRRYWRE